MAPPLSATTAAALLALLLPSPTAAWSGTALALNATGPGGVVATRSPVVLLQPNSAASSGVAQPMVLLLNSKCSSGASADGILHLSSRVDEVRYFSLSLSLSRLRAGRCALWRRCARVGSYLFFAPPVVPRARALLPRDPEILRFRDN